MLKKVFFLLVIMVILLTASVTVFAVETDSLNTEASFTKDEDINNDSQINIKSLDQKYGDIFFNENIVSNNQLVSIGYTRVYPYDTRHLFFAPIEDFDIDNPYIMLMYIKIDGNYVPLNDIEQKTNITEEVCYLDTTVDLHFIGTNKQNNIRIIVFRKNDVDKLKLDENLQITDMNISFRRWNAVEKVYFELKQLFN